MSIQPSHFHQDRPVDVQPETVFEQMDAPFNARAVKLYELWQANRPADDIPNRDAFSFELLNASGLVGFVFLIEPMSGGADWRYRLVGSQLTSFFNRDVTNIPFRQLFEETEADACITLSNRVAQTRTPVFLRGRILSFGHTGALETMSLPIWSRDGSEVWLLGGSFSELSERPQLGVFGNHWLS